MNKQEIFNDFMNTLEQLKGKEKIEKLLDETKDVIMDTMRIRQVRKLFKYLPFFQRMKFIIKHPSLLLPYK